MIKYLGGVALITADHGNADEMFETDKHGAVKTENGKPKAKTSYTLNPAPFIVYDSAHAGRCTLRRDLVRPGPANIAATARDLMGHLAPQGYEPSLIRWA